MSSFKGSNLFGSGPHRFAYAKQGILAILDIFNGGTTSDTDNIGGLELEVWVTGRLQAASEAALWTLRDAIVAQCPAAPVSGTLIDNTGRSLPTMKLYNYIEGDRTDRGRTWSIEYTAKFRRF